MRVVLILSLLFSAAMCGLVPSWWPSWVRHQPNNNESDLKEQAALLLRGSKDVGPEKLKRWLSEVEVLDDCSNSTYSNPDGGLISSPNYPGNYSDNFSCAYLIDLRTSADNVRLDFLDFDTERSYDYVKVYDGPSVNDPLLLSASGSLNPGSIFSSNAQMLVTFTTDSSVSDYRGFLATYSNGGCGLIYTELTGNITSTNYPGNYINNLDCEYTIDLRSSGASSVTLTFAGFQTEGGYDIVQVYEGLTTSGALLLNVSGNAIPAPVVSRTSQMLVRFTTDSSVVDRGFIATYAGI